MTRLRIKRKESSAEPVRKKGARIVWTLTGITCIVHVAVDDAKVKHSPGPFEALKVLLS